MPAVASLKATANWHCTWDKLDDSMLLVGVWRYGVGNWEDMQKDEGLGFHDKFFLEAHKKGTGSGEKNSMPAATHLLRRVEYLLHVVYQAEADNVKASNKKRDDADGAAHRPKPKVKKPSRERIDAEPLQRGKPADDQNAGYDSMDDDACKDALRPVKHQLKALKSLTKSGASMDKKEKVAFLRANVGPVAQHVNKIVAARPSNEREKFEKHLWVFISYFWPNPVDWQKLRATAAKMLAPSASDEPAAKKPKIDPPSRASFLSLSLVP